jgi:hypothetical protein
LLLGLLLLTLVPAALAQEDLTETYTSVRGRFSVRYPASWFAAENSNVIFLATDDALLDLRPDVPPGEATLNVSFSDRLSPLSRAFFQGNTTALGLAQTYSAFYETFGPITEVTLGGYRAARVSGPRPDAPLDTVMWGIDLGNGELAIAVGLTAPGELATFEPQFRAIAASLVDEESLPVVTPTPVMTEATPFSLEDLAESYSPPSGLFTMNYPSGWVAQDTSARSAVIASSEEAFGAGIQPPSGEVYMNLRFGSAPDLGLQGETLADQLAFYMGNDTALTGPDDLTIGGFPAVSLERSTSDTADIFVALIDVGDSQYVMAINFTAAGELAGFRAQLLSILDTLRLGTDEATEEATVEATPDATLESTPEATLEMTPEPTVTPTATPTATPVVCIVESAQPVNLRTGPGTGFGRAGALMPGDTAVINGQAQGDDGIWYRTTADTWVRRDVVQVPPECAGLATVTP